MVKGLRSRQALASLLNAYRTVCHYGADSVSHRIKNSEAFCKTLPFVLSNADCMFRDQVEIPTLNFSEQTVFFQKLKELPPWGGLKPFVKSYVRSTLFLLNQVTDTDILELALSRLRASLVFLTAFPSLLQRLIKVLKLKLVFPGLVIFFSGFLVIWLLIEHFGSETGSRAFVGNRWRWALIYCLSNHTGYYVSV